MGVEGGVVVVPAWEEVGGDSSVSFHLISSSCLISRSGKPLNEGLPCGDLSTESWWRAVGLLQVTMEPYQLTFSQVLNV